MNAEKIFELQYIKVANQFCTLIQAKNVLKSFRIIHNKFEATSLQHISSKSLLMSSFTVHLQVLHPVLIVSALGILCDNM